MKAVVVPEFGPPEVLTVREVNDPRPSAKQVVIGVEAAGVNYVDTLLRAGNPAVTGGMKPPDIPGNEVGGRIVAVGSEVDPALLGRPVVARAGGSGGYAERIAVAADAIIPVPDGLSLRGAVSLLAQGRAALGVTREARIVAGERVLVTAAAGGVGSLLVQLARNAGASTVVAAARGRPKLDLARQLGAQVTVDYGEPDWIDRVREASGGEGVDVAFDAVGGQIGHGAFDLLAGGGGRLLVYGFRNDDQVTFTARELFQRGVRVIGFGGPGPRGRWHAEIPQLIDEVLREAAAGRLKPIIGQTYPLAAAAEVHRAVEARATVGKTLLSP